jgi:hypothetical protein
MQTFAIPTFFSCGNDGFILSQIIKHYLDGTLPDIITAHREHIEEWDGARHAIQQHKACLRHTRCETDDPTPIAG